MNKYIDADKLIAEIAVLRKELPDTIEHLNDEESGFARGQQYELTAIEAEILCLQQEQPENKEKIMNFFAAVGDCGFSQHDILLLKNIWKETECTPPKSQVADASKMEQPELPPIGYAETYYQRGLRDGIIKGRINILSVLEDIEKGKAKPVLVIKEQDRPKVDLEKEMDAFFDKWDKNSYGCIFDENGTPVTIKTIKGVVKHFLNARKEE